MPAVSRLSPQSGVYAGRQVALYPVWCVPEGSGNAEQTAGYFTDGFCQTWVTRDGYCWLPTSRPAF